MKSVQLFSKAALVLALLTCLSGCATVNSGLSNPKFIEKQKTIRSITVLPLDATFEEWQGNGTKIPLYENMKTANKVSEEEILNLFKAKGYEINFFKPSEEISKTEDFKNAVAFYNKNLDKLFNSETQVTAGIGWPIPAAVSGGMPGDVYLFVRQAGFVKAQDAQMTEALTQGVITGAFALFTGVSTYAPPPDPSSALMTRAVLFDPEGEVLWHTEAPSLNDPRNTENIRSRLRDVFGGFPNCALHENAKVTGDTHEAKSTTN